MNIAIVDDILAWTELTTDITVSVLDQYGLPVTRAVSGGWYIVMTFIHGNGTISSVEEGSSVTSIGQHTGEGNNSAVFTYTRDQLDPGDITPTFTVQLETNFPLATRAKITLLDSAGDVMGGLGSI
jgi:hypothetical protein